MQKPTRVQILLGIIGTIFLGALGSGLWELLKPIFVGTGEVLVSIVTLGLTNLRDGFYSNAEREIDIK